MRQKLTGIEEGMALSVEGQVNHLLAKAQDPANLALHYHGWHAWV